LRNGSSASKNEELALRTAQRSTSSSIGEIATALPMIQRPANKSCGRASNGEVQIAHMSRAACSMSLPIIPGTLF
jgi:hypothetical protein